MSATCRSCGAPITWAKTYSGKRMPVDAATTDEGNVVLVAGEGPDPIARVLAGAALADARADRLPLHYSHFVTCAHSRTWRK